MCKLMPKSKQGRQVLQPKLLPSLQKGSTAQHKVAPQLRDTFRIRPRKNFPTTSYLHRQILKKETKHKCPKYGTWHLSAVFQPQLNHGNQHRPRYPVPTTWQNLGVNVFKSRYSSSWTHFENGHYLFCPTFVQSVDWLSRIRRPCGLRKE